MAPFGLAPYEYVRRIAETRMRAQNPFYQQMRLGTPNPGAASLDPARSPSFREILGKSLQEGALQSGLAGLADIPRGANFGTAFLATLGGYGKAQKAAEAAKAEALFRQQVEQRQVASDAE